MLASLVILTGASGVGKTSIAQLIEEMGTDILVYQGDRIGVPSGEIMANYGRMDEMNLVVQYSAALRCIGSE